ncbi:hypothetical protein UlMin_038674 [Ulmus minor]
MVPSSVRLYEQMPEPKYVIAMGVCTTGGMFNIDSYSTIRGVDKLIPVDVHLPSCPPKLENWCFTTSHKFHVGRSIYTGNYYQGLIYQPPSTSKIFTKIFFK